MLEIIQHNCRQSLFSRLQITAAIVLHLQLCCSNSQRVFSSPEIGPDGCQVPVSEMDGCCSSSPASVSASQQEFPPYSQVYVGCDKAAVSPIRPTNELIFSRPPGVPQHPPATTDISPVRAHSELPFLEGAQCLLPIWECLFICIFQSIQINAVSARLLLLATSKIFNVYHMFLQHGWLTLH